MKLNYGVLILAAGASTRMGTSKQLLKIKNQPLLRRTINTALEISCINCTVVLGANFDDHHKEIKDLPVDIINNTDWEKGMGSSIKAGIQNLKKYKVDAFYILVCDQPLLTSTHLKDLATSLEESKAPIVASSYKGAIGVPALFDWSMHSAILELPNEKGAKTIIQENCKLFVDLKGGEIDLDTRENYQNFLQSNS